MAAHRLICRELTHQLWVFLPLLTQEIAARPLVRHTLIHRDDRIKQNGEVRAHFKRRMRGDDRREMTTGREAHDAHIVRINAPHGRRVAHRADTLLHIANRLSSVSVGQTIIHHKISNASLIHPLGCQCALMRVRQHRIAAARHTHNGLARRVLRQEAAHLSRSVIRKIQRKFLSGLSKCPRSKPQQCHRSSHSPPAPCFCLCHGFSLSLVDAAKLRRINRTAKEIPKNMKRGILYSNVLGVETIKDKYRHHQ